MSLNIRLNNQTVSLAEFLSTDTVAVNAPARINLRKNGQTYCAVAVVESTGDPTQTKICDGYYGNCLEPTVKFRKGGKTYCGIKSLVPNYSDVSFVRWGGLNFNCKEVYATTTGLKRANPNSYYIDISHYTNYATVTASVKCAVKSINGGLVDMVSGNGSENTYTDTMNNFNIVITTNPDTTITGTSSQSFSRQFKFTPKSKYTSNNLKYEGDTYSRTAQIVVNVRNRTSGANLNNILANNTFTMSFVTDEVTAES